LTRRLSKDSFRKITFENPNPLVSDPRALRALAHPLRMRLLRALSLEGELTATEAAEHVGESPSSCSFHLRQLAKYGFVEEAERGPGRRRPWRRVGTGMRFELVQDDPDAGAAASTLASVLREGYLERIRHAAESFHALPAEWQAVTGHSDSVLYVTPEELRELDEQVLALLRTHHERIADPAKRPADARPVEVLVFAHPAEV
jgi:DNA-binding transcriptional ArsR family regulator